MKALFLISAIFSITVYKISDKTTKLPALFSQKLDRLAASKLVDHTLIITSDPAYKNAEFEINKEEYIQQRRSLVSFESDIRKEQVIFTRSVNVAQLVGDVDVIYDLQAFCFKTRDECAVILSN